MIYNHEANSFYVYIIECADGSFYTGITDDIVKRYEEHISGVDENCETFGKWPLKLRYYETIANALGATDRQNAIVALSHNDKLLLIESNGDPLPLLAVCNTIIRQNTKPIKKEIKKWRADRHRA